jgi:hypothetical protein
MKTGFINRLWITVPIVLVSVIANADTSSKGGITANESLDKALLELREQGFKTDLTNFDFLTSPELRARQRILEATLPDRKTGVFRDHPDLMEPAGSNQVVVVWKQAALRRQTPEWPNANYELTWEDFSDAINQNEQQIDAACGAILSGPIQFNLDASAGNMMLLPHLALLKNLTQTLNDRAVQALHDGNRDAAWTNLMAATRLVTAWNPEPVEISHRVRFGIARLVFNATWQVLQTNGWTDERLASLQKEWETLRFLGSLPEIQAFRRASDLKALEASSSELQVPVGGKEEDAARLLLFYRDREIEFSNAVQASTWLQMRQMPGVTNEIYFEPKNHYRGPFAMSLIHRSNSRYAMSQLYGGTSFLGMASEAEAERRIVIAALALERYLGKYGNYPETLQALMPEFLKSEPMDFMTGQPLHYRLAEGGHFLVYSVGLDCLDNGGQVPKQPSQGERFASLRNSNTAVPPSDIVWPLAASSMQTEGLRKGQTEEFAKQMAAVEARGRAAEIDGEQLRQAAMKKFLADNPSLGEEPVYQGKRLSAWMDKFGENEEYNAPKEDAVAAVRAIGPKAVPFLLAWMPHPGQEKPLEGLPDCDAAWWALGSEGKSAIPALAPA